MGVANKLSGGPLRRHLLTGGLAGGFLLAFHLPVRAANEPVPMAYAPVPTNMPCPSENRPP